MVQLAARAAGRPFPGRDNARADRRRRRTGARGERREEGGRVAVRRAEQRSLAAALSLDWCRRRVLVLRRERDGVALLELLDSGARCGPVCPHRLPRDEPVDLLEDRLEGRAHVAVGQGGSLDEEKFVLKNETSRTVQVKE